MVNWLTTVLFGVDKYAKISTCEKVIEKTKILQIRQFEDVRRNWPYAKTRRSSPQSYLT